MEDVQRGRNGDAFALRTAETHRRKGEDGRYFTVARTYRTVKASKNDGRVVSLEGFAKGDRVHVEGVEKTEKFNATDGREMYTLTVYADVVSGIQSEQRDNMSYPQPYKPGPPSGYVPDDEPF